MEPKFYIREQNNKFGVMVKGDDATVRGKGPTSSYWATTEYEPDYRPVEEWALLPIYDRIELLSESDPVGSALYKVIQKGHIGLYYVTTYDRDLECRRFKGGKSGPEEIAFQYKSKYDADRRIGRDADRRIELEAVTFESRFDYYNNGMRIGRFLGQIVGFFEKAIGGFVLKPEHLDIETEPSMTGRIYRLRVKGKYGLLWVDGGYWAKKPIYDDIREVAEDVFIARLGGSYGVSQLGRQRFDPDITLLEATESWRKVRRCVRDLAGLKCDIGALEKEWQVGTAERWWLFGG